MDKVNLKGKLAATQSKLENVEADGAKVLEHMYKMEVELTAVREDNARLQGECHDAHQSLGLLDQSQATLVAKLERTAAECEREKQRSSRFEHENIELRKRLTLLADHYENVKNQLSTLQNGMEDRLRVEQEAHAATQSKLDFAHKELDRAIRDHGHARAEAAYARSQSSMMLAARQQTLSSGGAATPSARPSSVVGSTPGSMMASASRVATAPAVSRRPSAVGSYSDSISHQGMRTGSVRRY